MKGIHGHHENLVNGAILWNIGVSPFSVPVLELLVYSTQGSQTVGNVQLLNDAQSFQ